MVLEVLYRGRDSRVCGARMEDLSRLLAFVWSVTVHVVGSLMIVEQPCLLPAPLAEDQQHYGALYGTS